MSNFDSTGRGANWSNGIAFCPRLPGALAASGVYLARRERAEQQENQDAKSEKAASERWSARVVPIAIFGFFSLGALAVFRRLVNGQGPVSDTVGSSYAGLKLVTTIGGLALVSVIAAGSSLRVMHALFDWPDPTNMGTVLSVWLALLSGGIIVLLLRHRKGQQTPPA